MIWLKDRQNMLMRVYEENEMVMEPMIYLNTIPLK